MITRILVLSYYYPPDLSAGAFRAQALVRALVAELGDQLQIDVVTTQPNRYHSYTADAAANESISGVNVRRISVSSHQSGFLDQSRAFATYALSARRLVTNSRYDLVVATSSRLMTATLGAILARRCQARLYLDIRDIFVDMLPELFSVNTGKLVARLFSPVERWTIRQAARVNLISPGFSSYFNNRYPNKEFSLYSNGVDDLFLSSPLFTAQMPVAKRRKRLRVVYAGNIGAGQGLDLILPELANRLSQTVEFQVIGDGGALHKLERELEQAKVRNVVITPPMRRERLLQAYHEADVLFLHLNNLKALQRVLPSKIFEYAATHKPIWAGLTGYSSQFAIENIKNVALFQPCDINGAVQALETLRVQPTSREEFVRQFSRSTIMQRMAKDVLHTSSCWH
ncbi:glycosyltransferase family 4 protein [Pseudomonas fontis]|uniref:Glycosyltransferase family 4 protein n=1 Tax=Pseudomonas fontis TaxID=2942633 RepID=A0ABT5NUU3_9PSED|nr:glycosyltransferase family 4 protein [Pseudomonas fontis]MDD0977173.1 glycosyltransferase family 4 protein [Pseudomonas fontis]MDD0991948.1 glycosyltransferase family 4 protein [Pseudomonas fontis]